MVTKKCDVTANGISAEVYTLSNGAVSADILTYGGRIITLNVADKNGTAINVVKGAGSAEDYIKYPMYYGAIIGRYGNRIGGARFTLNGQTYNLEPNERENTLHGGFSGFDKKVFAAEIDGDDALKLSYFSPDQEGGFPGNLNFCVRYQVVDDALSIEYFAESDKDTVVNFTNHAYFNLGGADILKHTLKINSSYITNVDDHLIPDKTLVNIKGTPFEFDGNSLEKNMYSDEHLITLCNGFDFNYCLDRNTADGLEECAVLFSPESGIQMNVFTTMPAVQLYTSNGVVTIGDTVLPIHSSLCLETQGYPDAPNCDAFPSTVLKSGEKYSSKTVYAFSVKK